MNIQSARVVEIRPHSLVVAVDTPSACGGCRSKNSCNPGGLRELPLAEGERGAYRVHDLLSLEVAPAATLQAAGLAYGLPMAGLLTGLLAAAGAGAGDGAVCLAAAGGLLLGLLGARAAAHRLADRMRISLHAAGNCGSTVR